ncbi:hypothetical protein [Bradyrhizobium sp. CSA112]|uniref:portal protein n=1 Tax=Bradyrhizobium sp. CSA112 TaxID=2699170 RepID=UPI0023AFD258|nr:hypothetical protein [Bradyrhizobium sp. CSA112]
MDAITPPDIQAQMSQALVPQPKPVTHDVTIVTTKKLAQAKVMGVPPEEFGVERGARNIRDCNYCFHEVVTKTEGQLIAEGFDEAQIRALGDYTGNTEIEQLARDSVGENYGTQSGGVNSAARLVKITEHYVRMDYEGNGRPCLYQVITGGDQGELLKKDGKDCITPFDAIPFATTTPVPITHRFFGRSIADLVMPAQREKTALKRGALDNLYLHNNPRVEVAEANAGPNTLDDLLVSRPGGVVRTKTAGGLNWQVVPDITGSVYPMMQYIDAELETRTGLSKQMQGVDANALQNQSATAVAQVFSASQMRVKLIARIMAEGVRDIFSLLHGTIRKHGQQQQTVRLRNTWVPVDPRQWKTRNDMTIAVGLGSGGKAQQFAQIMALANFQKELLLGGKSNLVDDQALYNTGAALVKVMGYKNPDKFLNDPSAKDPQTGQPLHPPVPPPPDPDLIKVQADTQIKQAELQQREKEIVANAQIAQQADERKAQIEAVQAEADMATEQQKLQGEMALAQQKFELERELKLMEFQLKKQMHDEEMQMRREQHEQQMQAGVFKVAAGAEAHDQRMEQMKNAPKPKGGK